MGTPEILGAALVELEDDEVTTLELEVTGMLEETELGGTEDGVGPAEELDTTTELLVGTVEELTGTADELGVAGDAVGVRFALHIR